MILNDQNFPVQMKYNEKNLFPSLQEQHCFWSLGCQRAEDGCNLHSTPITTHFSEPILMSSMTKYLILNQIMEWWLVGGIFGLFLSPCICCNFYGCPLYVLLFYCTVHIVCPWFNKNRPMVVISDLWAIKCNSGCFLISKPQSIRVPGQYVVTKLLWNTSHKSKINCLPWREIWNFQELFSLMIFSLIHKYYSTCFNTSLI